MTKWQAEVDRLQALSLLNELQAENDALRQQATLDLIMRCVS